MSDVSWLWLVDLTWFIHSDLLMGHDSFTVTHRRNMTHRHDTTHSPFTSTWHDSSTVTCWWDMTHSQWLIDVTWLIDMTRLIHHSHRHDMTHSSVWHDSFIRIIQLMHMSQTHWVMIHGVCHVPIESWLVLHWCDMSHLRVRRDAFTRATWLIHTCDVTHSTARHDSCIQQITDDSHHVCDVTHSCVWHDWFTRATCLIYTTDCRRFTSRVWYDSSTSYVRHRHHMCKMTHFYHYVWHVSFTKCVYICDIIWIRDRS